jgi:RNA polymerase sigma factor (sigma-70 family)
MRAERSGRPTEPKQLGDAELLASADVELFAEFYRRHARRLAGYLMRATGEAEVAADLTAETFAAALQDRDRYRPQQGAPTTWLYGIAAHKLTDWWRRGYAEDRARRRLGMERIELSDADVRELEYLASDVRVVDMLDELPTEQRAAVQARLIHGRDYGEIAGAKGVSETVVRQRVSRGLAGLRRKIGGRV